MVGPRPYQPVPLRGPWINQENKLKVQKFKSVVALVLNDAENESQSEMEKVSLFPKLGKNKVKNKWIKRKNKKKILKVNDDTTQTTYAKSTP